MLMDMSKTTRMQDHQLLSTRATQMRKMLSVNLQTVCWMLMDMGLTMRLQDSQLVSTRATRMRQMLPAPRPAFPQLTTKCSIRCPLILSICSQGQVAWQQHVQEA
jgi:hypothetical protein